MSLASGIRLGPYEITSPLGAGGMGEVYRARDTRLERTVAIKVLPANLAQRPEARQRFEREARAISALNHPHICILHDVGRQDGIDFLVMELLEGETLAVRLRKGALPREQVLTYGVQIAEALDRAHRQGIVHRDLKPGNVMLTKVGAKLLDFGLAKLRSAQTTPPPSETSEPRTASEAAALTGEGAVMGTAGYMAPEQLQGKEPDARTDIFAFGAMLYEMATGRRAFTGDRASVIAAILTAQPAPIRSLQPELPPALDRIVAACLAKDPDERWQSARDLSRELNWIAEAGPQEGVRSSGAAWRRGRERLAWTVATTLLVAALVFAVTRRRENAGKPLQARFQIHAPANTTFSGWDMAVSPEGERIAFTASVGDDSHLFVRPLNSITATRVSGTEGAADPFWSPDGRQIGFRAQWKVKTVDLSGAPPQTVSDTRIASGISWGQGGVIIFSANGELFRVPASGGDAEPLGKRAEGETVRLWPRFLPDGRRYLYFSLALSPERQGTYVASLDSDERKLILATDHNAVYLPSGHLLFVRRNVLMAQAFDVDRMDLSGEPFPVVEQVALYRGSLTGAAYSVSLNGVLAWRTGSNVTSNQLTWFDRSGTKLGTVGEPGDYSNPALSPDDKSLAVGRSDPQKKTRDLWIFDLVHGASRRLTFDPADDANPAWSPDGNRIAFTSDRRRGVREIYQKRANGAGDDELLLKSADRWKNVEDWSADGQFLLFNYFRADRGVDLMLLPLASGPDPQPAPFVTTGSADMGQFAPNSRWVAYHSGESGRDEIYVRGLSSDGVADGGKWQVSSAGGVDPKWRRDGRELFYFSGSTLMAVDVRTDQASFEAGIPKPLFDARLPPETRRNRFVVARDGQRFLLNVLVEQTAEPIQVLVNALPPSR